ncbi:Uncharacterised protein [Mycobacteroides abscessus subsp. massiliense]|uniref:hypothetical protein n=1 Tax=Mycobacteroides abscessus TaxID=36809 RepID=UPI0009D4F576|nr:hypothetical protein [Mycobacteroides abscessus]SLB29745.1 Uncharacterised protein [Mycobacteroides abscessus subsp. massiliense]
MLLLHRLAQLLGVMPQQLGTVVWVAVPAPLSSREDRVCTEFSRRRSAAGNHR